MVKRIAWSFKDPSAFTGSLETVQEHIREVREEIEQQVKAFVLASLISYWIPPPRPPITES